MFDMLQAYAGDIATLMFGLAAGGAWAAVIAAPNVSYDRLDASRADGHVRTLLLETCTPISGLLLAAAALSLLAGHMAAAIVAGVGAFGFFTNRWTLAAKKKGEAPPGVRQKKKTQRVVAVSFSLIFAVVALAGAVLSIIGI